MTYQTCVPLGFDDVRTFVRGPSPRIAAPTPGTGVCVCGLYAGIEEWVCPYCSESKVLLTVKERRGAPRTSREAIDEARSEFDAMAEQVRGKAPSKKSLRLARAEGHGKNATPQWLLDEVAEEEEKLRALTTGDIA